MYDTVPVFDILRRSHICSENSSPSKFSCFVACRPCRPLKMYQLKVIFLCFFAHALCAQGLSGSSLTRSARQNRFFEVANAANTDKVSVHHYEALYNKYLDPVRHEPLRLLEGKFKALITFRKMERLMLMLFLVTFCANANTVGLGCDMGYGPGHSLKVMPSS